MVHRLWAFLFFHAVSVQRRATPSKISDKWSSSLVAKHWEY
jgi:hypothetical protein